MARTPAATGIQLAPSGEPQFIKPSAIEDLWGMDMLLMGPYGTGKTYLLGTAVESENCGGMLLIDIDRSASRVFPHRSDFEVYEPASTTAALRFHSWLADNKHPFRTICIDSATDLQTEDVRGRIRRSTAQSSSEYVYRESNAAMVEGLREYRKLCLQRGWNLIVTARVREDKEEGSDRAIIRPGLTPRVAEELGGLFNAVGYLRKRFKGREVERVLSFEETPGVHAKLRQPPIGPQLELHRVNPTLPPILDWAAAMREFIQARQKEA